jgi:hypothetical protein
MSTPLSDPVTSGLITISNGAEAISVDIVYDSTFYQRVAAIATSTAFAVCREEDGGANIAGHPSRETRALQWFSQCSTSTWQIAMAMAVTQRNTINETSTSQEIADELAFLWDTLSGN